MTDILTPVIDRIKKIYQYSLRGTGGEKENAQKILEALLKKHNLTIEQIASPDRKWEYIDWRDKVDRMLLIQIISYVLSTGSISSKHLNKTIAIELTPSEYVDILECFQHYRKEWKKELPFVMRAFFRKHNLYPANVTNDEIRAARAAITEQEREDLLRIEAISTGLNSQRWNARRKLESAAESLRD